MLEESGGHIAAATLFGDSTCYQQTTDSPACERAQVVHTQTARVPSVPSVSSVARAGFSHRPLQSWWSRMDGSWAMQVVEDLLLSRIALMYRWDGDSYRCPVQPLPQCAVCSVSCGCPAIQ